MITRKKIVSAAVAAFFLMSLIMVAVMGNGTALSAKAAENHLLESYFRQHEPVKKVRVAVLDTGLEKDSVSCGIQDTGINLSGTGEKDSTTDDNGHGTKVAKIITEYGSDYIELLPVKVADASGEAVVEKICRGFQKAAAYEPDIILLSLNTVPSKEAEQLKECVKEAEQKGILVVVPAGNNSMDVKNAVPADLKEAIVVTATGADRKHIAYSNYGDTVDYAAYGGYDGEYGTSFAAARVAGMLAGILARGENEELLEKAAQDLGTVGQDMYYGKGYLTVQEWE